MIRFGKRLQRSFRVIALLAMAVWLLGPTAEEAAAIPLSELFVDTDVPQTITAGDKLFTNWTLLSNGDNTDLSQIDVTPLNDPANNPGLRYTDTGGVLTLDTLGEEFGFSFQYTVTVLDPSQMIIGNSLELVDFATENFALLEVQETVQDIGQTTTIATKTVASQGQPPFEQPFDEVAFLPQQGLVVTTIFLGLIEGEGDFAQLAQLDQRFAQAEIPEPASLGLFLAGLIGFGLLSRFSRRPRAAQG